MAATRTARKSTNNRPKPVVTTITKEDAFALVKGGELNPNKYRRPCHLCGEIVDAGAGVLGGNKTEGWWAAHEDGACFKPAKKTTARKGSASKPKNVAAEEESAAKVEEVNVPVRGTRKVNQNMAAAKKTVARRTTKRAASTPAAPKRPVAKRTAPKKVTPNKPAEVAEESASTEEEGAEFAELDTAAQTLVKAFIARIADGTLDGALSMLDDAIGDRLDAVEAASKPAPKKTTARKSTTPAKTAAEKVAPVKRAAKSSGSASASKPSAATEEVEIVKVPKPVRGRDYMVNPKLKNKYAGLLITFKSYVPDSDNKKASVTIRQEFGGKPEGSRLVIPVSSIVVDPDA